MTNPYHATATVEPRRRLNVGTVVQRLYWSYPVLVPIVLHVTWLIAWACLGHAPRPSLDDPKSIATVVDIGCYATGAMLILIPAVAIGGIAGEFMQPERRRTDRIVRAALLIVLWCACIGCLRWDPLSAADWMMD